MAYPKADLLPRNHPVSYSRDSGQGLCLALKSLAAGARLPQFTSYFCRFFCCVTLAKSLHLSKVWFPHL